MADPIASTDVFKFVALRPPTPPKQQDQRLSLIRDVRVARETPVGAWVANVPPDAGPRIGELLRQFIGQHSYRLDYPQGEGDPRLSAIDQAVAAVPAAQVSTDHLLGVIGNAVGEDARAYATDARQHQLPRIWDSYYAYLLLSRVEPQNLDQLTTNLRVLHLLDLLLNAVDLPDAATLRQVRTATPVIDPLFAGAPKPPIPQPPASVASASRLEEYQQAWSDALDLHTALEELRSLRREPQTTTTQEDVEIPDRETGRAVSTKMVRTQLASRISPAAVANLRPQTKALLADAGISEDEIAVPQAVSALSTRLADVTTKLALADDPDVVAAMPQQVMELRGLANVVDHASLTINAPHIFGPINVRASIKPLGIGDLKVVKQTLKKYAAGEVAHIENVLRGEYKERKHRELDRTEQTVTVETETEQETTKDTQTTERFELKKESENTIQEQMSVQAGVTVTASYGPVTLGAHGDFAYSTSSSESEKTASNYAREVVDRSVTRIQTKTREERVTKTLHEVEEIDTHGIDNKDKADHAIGVYRWVDKYYQAQIYNYGKRLMFEFIVPEPAAFYEYAQTHQPPKGVAATAPKPLGNLTFKDISELNYQKYIAYYGVQGCTPPSPEYKVVAATLSSDAQIANGTSLAKSSKDLVVPDGYVLDDLAYSASFVYENYPQWHLSIGTDDLSWQVRNDTARRRFDDAAGPGGGYDGIIPVALDCYDVNAYFVDVAAYCKRTTERYEQWQIQTYEKIVAAYQALQAAYEQKLSAQSSQDLTAIHGQNPGINRDIEKGELKRQCVELLMDTWLYGSFSAMKQATPDDPPDMDIVQAISEGKQIQFFEQAFEWENLTYLFYPYFWGRQEQWAHKLTTFDEDPLFTKFLQAGAARVVLPVHPGYNDAVMYFLEHNGVIWQGGDPPTLGDPLFISLADELHDQTDDLQNATPEGDPWQVVLPTTLVYLQQDASLPTFP